MVLSHWDGVIDVTSYLVYYRVANIKVGGFEMRYGNFIKGASSYRVLLLVLLAGGASFALDRVPRTLGF